MDNMHRYTLIQRTLWKHLKTLVILKIHYISRLSNWTRRYQKYKNCFYTVYVVCYIAGCCIKICMFIALRVRPYLRMSC